MEPRMRASPEQFGILIEFMERYGDLSRPQTGPQGKIKSDRLWSELCTLLNSVGGGVQKSTDKWKKVWADWKTKTKKKYLTIRQHADATGGGPSRSNFLTALEERVVAILGVSSVLGQAGIQEAGFNRPSELVPQEEEVINHGPNIRIDLFQQASSAGPSTAPPPAEETPASPPSLPQAVPPGPTTPTHSLREASASPRYVPRTPRRSLLRARRNRGLTPFDRAASEFVAVEQGRLKLEEVRERHLHEREMERLQLEKERLRLEDERVKVAHENNQILHQLSVIGQNLLNVLTRQQFDQ